MSEFIPYYVDDEIMNAPQDGSDEDYASAYHNLRVMVEKANGTWIKERPDGYGC